MYLSRRSLLAFGATVVVTACSGSNRDNQTTATTEYEPLPSPSLTGAKPYSGAFPFTLGVAAGDPEPHRVVLWTRLAPDPLGINGGMDDGSYVVTWEFAIDEQFSEVTVSGTTVAEAKFAHSVHVDVIQLEPAVSFWYRFRAGAHVSPVGRVATTPLFTMPDLVTVATVSGGPPATHSRVYADLAISEPDLVIFAGEYTTISPSDGLADCRSRHTRSLLSSELQAARAAAGWLVAHGAGQIDTDAATQAWWEHMPVRLPPPSAGERLAAYRHCVVGSLVDLILLDAHVDGSGRERLGKDQERWLSREPVQTKVVWYATAGSDDAALAERVHTLLTKGGAENPVELGGAVDTGSTPSWRQHVVTPERWTTTTHRVDSSSGIVSISDEVVVQVGDSSKAP